MVYAVCGAGKTELSFAVMQKAVSEGKKVGFALPRRDVVIELYERLKDAFSSNKVVAIYGGHTDQLEADIVVLTTHQLYRYEKYFDLLIMDEIDAFPFEGDDLLISMFHRALKGNCVMMSATPSREIVTEFKKPGHDILVLMTRFHKQPIPVPEIVIRFSIFKFAYLLFWLRKKMKEKKPVLVFVPTVDASKTLYRFLSFFVKGGNYVNSKRENRPKIIQSFKKGEYKYLVTTAVLERGVTIENLQVLIYEADDAIYDAASLIQIAGRVGRKAKAPSGDVVFLAEKTNDEMRRAIDEIKYCNKHLQGMS